MSSARVVCPAWKLVDLVGVGVSVCLRSCSKNEDVCQGEDKLPGLIPFGPKRMPPCAHHRAIATDFPVMPMQLYITPTLKPLYTWIRAASHRISVRIEIP